VVRTLITEIVAYPDHIQIRGILPCLDSGTPQSNGLWLSDQRVEADAHQCGSPAYAGR
ncbi:MAG: hypothetical protein JWO42_1347, partial [Chloroflexi bacterium]|nr:hypothetical protein [Chloroflexota bacterium]